MKMATTRWTRFAEAVAQAGCSKFPRVAHACKDKWTTLFSDYKKLFDYKTETELHEDYFRMSSKRSKELYLPPNFSSTHDRDMDRFLHQRPCLVPPHQKETMGDDDHVFVAATQLWDFCAAKNVDPHTIVYNNFVCDPVTHLSPMSRSKERSAGQLPPRPPTPSAYGGA